MVDQKDLGVIINMIIFVEYGRRRSGLPNAPLDMDYDNNSIEI